MRLKVLEMESILCSPWKGSRQGGTGALTTHSPASSSPTTAQLYSAEQNSSKNSHAIPENTGLSEKVFLLPDPPCNICINLIYRCALSSCQEELGHPRCMSAPFWGNLIYWLKGKPSQSWKMPKLWFFTLKTGYKQVF